MVSTHEQSIGPLGCRIPSFDSATGLDRLRLKRFLSIDSHFFEGLLNFLDLALVPLGETRHFICTLNRTFEIRPGGTPVGQTTKPILDC